MQLCGWPFCSALNGLLVGCAQLHERAPNCLATLLNAAACAGSRCWTQKCTLQGQTRACLSKMLLRSLQVSMTLTLSVWMRRNAWTAGARLT